MSDAESFKYNPEEMTELYTLYKSDLDYIKVLKQNANNQYILNNGGGSGTTVDWADITGKPATYTPTIGNTGTTAKAGNWVPAWNDVTGKPAVIAAGADAAAARSAIGAGTSNLTIGTTASTAKAGNYQPTWEQVTDKPAVIAAGADQAAARTAIGAGTSNLVIGTTSTTAKAGNYVPTWTEVTGKPTTFTPPAATEAAIGGVKMAETQADSTATDIETLVSDFNSLLAKLRAAGIMA